MPEASARYNFYKYSNAAGSLDTYVHDQVRIRFACRRAEMLDERNIHSYRHGNRWSLEASADGLSEMHSMGAEATIHSLDIINHETAVIEEYIETMAEQLYAALMKHLLQTVSEVAETVGNVIQRKDHEGNIPAGFLAMLEKIEFGVDRYGRAQRPAVHVAPSKGREMLEALRSQSVEYHIKVETMVEQKEKKAVMLEAERISKFLWRLR